jgi:hypothetical protein
LASGDMLEACSAKPVNAHNVCDATELEQAFESIGGAIVALRLTKEALPGAKTFDLRSPCRYAI